MLESFNRRVMAFKLESVEGTDALPTAALNAVQIMNGASRIEADTLDRNLDRSTFGGRRATLVRKRGMMSGEVEIVGNATAGDSAPIAELLKACGHVETLDAGVSSIITPVSSGIPSGTGYFWHSGERYRITGARGSVSEFNFSIDDYPKATIAQILGKALAMTEQALPTDADYADFQVPPVIVEENSIMTVDGFQVDGKSLVIRPNVDLQLIHHTEGRVARHVDRVTEVTLRFFRSAYADLDIHSIVESETAVPVTFDITTTAGKNIAVSLPSVQLLQPVPTEIDGMFAWEVTGRALPDSGDDEYAIQFT